MKFWKSLLICFHAVNTIKEQQKEKRKKSVWVKDWLSKRNKKGAYHAILNKLKLTGFEHSADTCV